MHRCTGLIQRMVVPYVAQRRTECNGMHNGGYPALSCALDVLDGC
jgi:hypothetical protein